MGCCCPIKELMKQLDYIKNGMNVWGRDYDLSQLHYSLRHHIKEYYPLNGVPQHIVDSLDALKARIELAEEQMILTCDVIIHHLEKDLPA